MVFNFTLVKLDLNGVWPKLIEAIPLSQALSSLIYSLRIAKHQKSIYLIMRDYHLT